MQQNISEKSIMQENNPLITVIEQSNNSFKPQQNIYLSEKVVQRFLDEILVAVKQEYLERKIIRTKMTQYSTQITAIYLKQLALMHLDKKQMQKIINEQEQALPLRSDNLFPSAIDLQSRQQSIEKRDESNDSTLKKSRNMSIKNLLTNKNSISGSQNQPKRSSKMESYLKLDEQITSDISIKQDPFIDEIRRQKQLISQNTPLNDNKNKKIKNQMISKGEIQKISYDFAGNVIKVKRQKQKDNFIEQNIQGNKNRQIYKQKEIKQGSKNPIQLESVGINKKQKTKLVSKKGQEIEFSNINTLTNDMNINEGVKFIHNKITLEKKKKEQSLFDLKKNLTSKKLTKNDLNRLKQLGTNKSLKQKSQIQSLPTIIKSETDVIDVNESMDKRSFSESKLNISEQNTSRRLKDQRKGKICIENEQLIELLLDKLGMTTIEDTMKLKLPQQNTERSNKYESLSLMDKANLNYIKTGSVGKLQLPKISYRINKKVKDQKQIKPKYNK